VSGPDNDVSTASKTISSKFSLSGKAGGSQTLFGEETSTYSDLDETEFNVNPKSNKEPAQDCHSTIAADSSECLIDFSPFTSHDINHDHLLECNESISLDNCSASVVKSASGSSNVTSGSQIQNTTDIQDCKSAKS